MDNEDCYKEASEKLIEYIIGLNRSVHINVPEEVLDHCAVISIYNQITEKKEDETR